MSSSDYDVVIAGGGIAGLTAGLTAARAGRRTRVLTGPALGGQLLNIERVDGFSGFPEGIPGYNLCPIVQEQAVAAGAAEVLAHDRSVVRLETRARPAPHLLRGAVAARSVSPIPQPPLSKSTACGLTKALM